MSPTSNFNDLGRRLAKLEGVTRFNDPRLQKAVTWTIEGPHNLPDGGAVAFLWDCGHDVRDEDFNIIRVIVGAEDGRPVDLPLKDRTSGQPR